MAHPGCRISARDTEPFPVPTNTFMLGNLQDPVISRHRQSNAMLSSVDATPRRLADTAN
jgi:hypothetical protein